VSEFVRVTDDLRESLKMQEFLNDKLISAALLQQKTVSSAMRALARLAEYRDHHTGDHLQRICEYSRLIAGEIFRRQPYGFKIRSEYCDDIINSSMLHDIGKVVIPDNILLKKGRLDNEEWKIMQSHTVKGWTILNQADCELGEQSFLTLASQIALNHHERWDGSGYPNGLTGEKIPLSARICAVADVYDALTSLRPYKSAWQHEEAMGEIRSMGETAFDPVIVDILLSVEKKMLDIRRRFPK
jgi:response regulator RpfG family c-di-GMP phosphodiesterase